MNKRSVGKAGVETDIALSSGRDCGDGEDALWSSADDADPLGCARGCEAAAGAAALGAQRCSERKPGCTGTGTGGRMMWFARVGVPIAGHDAEGGAAARVQRERRSSSSSSSGSSIMTSVPFADNDTTPDKDGGGGRSGRADGDAAAT